jgi:hypothetical protein
MEEMSLEELQAVADTVGVGYNDLDQPELLAKLLFEAE